MRLRLLMLLVVLPFMVGAAEPDYTVRPVLSAYTLRVGSAHAAETYLSPLRYSGVALGLDYERMQAMKFSPEHWVADLRLDLNGALTHSPVGNATTYQLFLNAGWGMMHRWKVGNRWTLCAGGSTDIEGGMFYTQRNSNNPVAAKASWTVSAMGAAVLATRLGACPLYLRYQVRIPATGIFFSPEYGELYYEIYLGNHRNLIRAAWPGNFFRMDNLLTADLRFGASILRVGYGLDIQSSKASDIVTRRINHCAVVGFCSEWVSLSVNRSDATEARIISAMY